MDLGLPQDYHNDFSKVKSKSCLLWTPLSHSTKSINLEQLQGDTWMIKIFWVLLICYSRPYDDSNKTQFDPVQSPLKRENPVDKNFKT